MKRLILIFTNLLFLSSAYSQFTDEQITEFINRGNDQEILEKNTFCILEGNYLHALLLADKLLSIAPDNINYHYRKGYSILYSTSEFSGAIPHLEKSVGRISKNYDIFSTKEKGAPTDAHYHLGWAYHLNNDIDKAREQYNIFLSNAPKKSPLTDIANLKIRQLENAEISFERPHKGTTVVNLGTIINSTAPDYSPVVSLDGFALYFTSRRKRDDGSNAEIFEPGTAVHLEDIYVSRKDVDGNWTIPELMDFSRPERNEATVALSIDERRIYVYMDETGNGDLYYSDFRANKFQDLRLLKIDGINTDFWEPHITVSPDGRQIYFSSDRPGGFGGRDIYRVVKLPNGEWSQPQNLGPEINTPFDEDAPFIAIDNKTMYFASNGPKSIGGFDIFMTIQDDNGKWATPVNLGTPINSTSDDIYYTTTVDGLTGYITSFRPGGIGEKDIYEVKNDYLGMNNISVLRGEIETVGGRPIPEDIGFTVRCLTCGNKFDMDLYPRLPDGSFISSLQPCHEFEVIFHYSNGEKEIYREIIKTQCERGYEEIYRHILIDLETMTIVQPKEEIPSFPPLAMKHYFGYNRNKLNTNEGALKMFLDALEQQIADGRESLSITINSSASKVPTRTFGNNEKLAQTRAEQLDQLLNDYFKNKPEIRNAISIRVGQVKVDGPEYEGKDFKNVGKYSPYQFVEIRVDGENSMDEPTLLNSKDAELDGKSEISSKPVSSFVDRKGDEFTSGQMIESDYRYHAVVGVFSRIDNAEGMVRKLKKQGFDGAIIGKRNGLHVVSAGAANRISDITPLLEKARAEVASSAWILNTSK